MMPLQMLRVALFTLLLLSFPLWAQNQPQTFNYDEDKVGEYTLPDPLVMNDGSKVTNAQQWRKRRAEILRLYETHVYGRTPKTPAVRFSETSRADKALNGLATRREITVWLTGKTGGPHLNLLVYVPNKRAGRVPAFLALNFRGNHAISNDPGIALSSAWMSPTRDETVVNNRATEKSRGAAASRWSLDLILSRGYAVATFYYGDVFPDHKDGLKDSIIPYFTKTQQADDWNAIGAWAWGLSRAMDVLEKDRDIDPQRVAIMGHSRLGKAALWAGAQDERFALVVSNESGEGGAALARRNFGETVARINTSFPHWFCANFKKYNDRAAELPVDQHMLIALMAPRPVYIASAVEDQWADPHGEFLSGLAAAPVYRLLGTDGLSAPEWPGVHQPVMSRIGYHLRAGKHDVTQYDWEQYLNFADRQMRHQ